MPEFEIKGVPITGQATAPTPEATPTATPEAPAGAEIPRELSPLERFHPSLDPAKVELTFDERTGRVKAIPKTVEAAPVEDPGPVEDESPAYEAPPEVLTSATTAPTSEVQQLREQIAQQNQILTAMFTAQATGRPLSEVLGMPAQPAEPDYSQVDMYDPASAASFIRQTVQSAVRGELASHQQAVAQTTEQARREQELKATQVKYGADPHFQYKAVAAISLVKDNPALSIEAAYEQVNRGATSQPQQSTAATQPSAVNNAPRTTLTPAEQQALADKAKTLPSQSSGVRGAGPQINPPKGLGNKMAWVTQQAQLGNLDAIARSLGLPV